MPQLGQRDYYTTGEMARAIGCAQQTVIRQIDAGRLPGFRMPGPFGPRRCPKAVFREYLAAQGIPVAQLERFEQRAQQARAVNATKGT